MKAIAVVLALMGTAFVAGLVAESHVTEFPGPVLTMPVVVDAVPHPVVHRALVKVFGGSSKVITFIDIHGKARYTLYASALMLLTNANVVNTEYKLQCWIDSDEGYRYGGGDYSFKTVSLLPREAKVVEVGAVLEVKPFAKPVMFNMYCVEPTFAPFNRHKFTYKFVGAN